MKCIKHAQVILPPFGEITKSQGNSITVISGVKNLRGTSDQVARIFHFH